MDSPTRRRTDSAEQVIAFIRDGISRQEFRPGDRLPPERELATQLGVSRPTVRAGLRALSAMGVIESRHGSGTYIPDGPPRLGSEPLSFLAALHGFTLEEMYEARRVLEVSAAGLAAERATHEDLAGIAEEVASLFAAMNDPLRFLGHDIRFHRAVATAAHNPIIASLVEMVSALYDERRRETAALATDRDLHDAAEMHHRVYQAIRARDVDQARDLMAAHLLHSAAFPAGEPKGKPGKPARRKRTAAQAGDKGAEGHRGTGAQGHRGRGAQGQRGTGA